MDTMTSSHLQLEDTIRLGTTSASIPRLGFGVWQVPGGNVYQATQTALNHGFRHVDCAQLYRNEADVGAAVHESSVPRDQVFLTTKVGKKSATPAETYVDVLESIERVGGPGGYVDLLLVHTPDFGRDTREELWVTFERLYREGRAKAIGVSNYLVMHLEEMKEFAQIWPPHVNQIELHPWCQQRDLVAFCQANKILVQAYSPLATGERFDDQAPRDVASKHGRSIAQVLIRYALQKGWVPLPKSQHEPHIQENTEVFDFELDDQDMETLDSLEQGIQGLQLPNNILK